MADKIDRYLSMVSVHRKALREIADRHGFTLDELKANPNRKPAAVKARAECMAYLKLRRRWSYPMIGREFNRHHTTAMYAIKKFEAEETFTGGLAGYVWPSVNGERA
jgi:chromosomal replication initiation ATPase DnaA